MGNSLLGSYVSYVKLKGQEKDSEKSGDGRCEIRYELNDPKTPGNKTIAWSFTPNEKELERLFAYYRHRPAEDSRPRQAMKDRARQTDRRSALRRIDRALQE